LKVSVTRKKEGILFLSPSRKGMDGTEIRKGVTPFLTSGKGERNKRALTRRVHLGKTVLSLTMLILSYWEGEKGFSQGGKKGPFAVLREEEELYKETR